MKEFDAEWSNTVIAVGAGADSKPGLVKQFIADLNSGKLHREFHHGPDLEPSPAPVEKKADEPVGWRIFVFIQGSCRSGKTGKSQGIWVVGERSEENIVW